MIAALVFALFLIALCGGVTWLLRLDTNTPDTTRLLMIEAYFERLSAGQQRALILARLADKAYDAREATRLLADLTRAFASTAPHMRRFADVWRRVNA